MITRKDAKDMSASFEECNCSCHYPGSIKKKHCMPCCCECPKCGKHIRRLYIEEHEKKCKKDWESEVLKESREWTKAFKKVKEDIEGPDPKDGTVRIK